MDIDDMEVQELDNIFNDAYNKTSSLREAYRFAMMRYAEIYHDREVKKLNIPAVISRFKNDLDKWIESCERAAGNLRDIGHSNEAQNFDGQATAYWAAKNYLDVNGL